MIFLRKRRVSFPHRLLRGKEDIDRRERSDRNKDDRKRKKLRDPLDLGELVFVLAERLKKKDVTGKFYKSSTENKPSFNKNKIFIIRKGLSTENQETLLLDF